MAEMVKTVNVSVVDCCATCEHWAGWLDNMQCLHHGMDVKPCWICDSFKPVKQPDKCGMIVDGGPA